MYNQQYGQQQNYMNNPYQNAQMQQQQRLAQMEQQRQDYLQNQLSQMQPQQQQMQQPMQQNDFSLQGKQVTAIEEVKAFSIPLDGSTSYFPSSDGKTIYTKKLNLDGTCNVITYKIYEEPIQASDPNSNIEYVSKEEFNALKQELENYKNLLLGGNEDAK